MLFLCLACTFDICIKLLLTYLLTVIPDTSFASGQEQFVTMASPTVSCRKTSLKKLQHLYLPDQTQVYMQTINQHVCVLIPDIQYRVDSIAGDK